MTSGECLLTGACNRQSYINEKTNEDLQHSLSDNSSRLVQTSDNRTQSVYLSDCVKDDTSNELDTDDDCKQSYSACDTETHGKGGHGFPCTVCSKTFKYASTLKNHMRSHTGERPFNCKVCGKAYTSSSYLNVHMRSHTGERPFSCNVCSKAFVCISRLNGHMRSHERTAIELQSV